MEAHKLFMEETGAAQEIKEYVSGLPDGLTDMKQCHEVSKKLSNYWSERNPPGNKRAGKSKLPDSVQKTRDV